jgi:hypothetical protein
MSTAQLYNIPTTPREVAEWTLANADSHTLIINAILAKYNMQLEMYVLDPVPQFDLQNFLLRHQQAHDQFESVLNIEGNDYTSLDFNNPEAVHYLFYQHANEHILAHSQLGI